MSISLSPAIRGAGALVFVAVAASTVPAAAVADSRPKLLTPVLESWAKDNPTSNSPFQVEQGGEVRFKVKSPGGPVFVIVAKTDDELRNVDAESIKRSVYLRQMSPKGDAYVDRVPVYPAYDAFWTNAPKTYWWTAVRIDCEAAKEDDDCVLEAKPRRFEVVEGTVG